MPIWWDESDRVSFDVKRKTSRSRAATDRAEKQDTANNQPAVPGRYYVPEPRANDGGELPTFRQWLKDLDRLEGRKRLVQ